MLSHMPRSKPGVCVTLAPEIHEALRATGSTTGTIEALVRAALTVPERPTERECRELARRLKGIIAGA
jgi:hypothetical protein